MLLVHTAISKSIKISMEAQDTVVVVGAAAFLYLLT